MVSRNCPITVEHFVIIFVTQYVTVAIVRPAKHPQVRPAKHPQLNLSELLPKQQHCDLTPRVQSHLEFSKL